MLRWMIFFSLSRSQMCSLCFSFTLCASMFSFCLALFHLHFHMAHWLNAEPPKRMHQHCIHTHTWKRHTIYDVFTIIEKTNCTFRAIRLERHTVITSQAECILAPPPIVFTCPLFQLLSLVHHFSLAHSLSRYQLICLYSRGSEPIENKTIITISSSISRECYWISRIKKEKNNQHKYPTFVFSINKTNYIFATIAIK